jgi:transcriptional regulator with XRE-family HTH domain
MFDVKEASMNKKEEMRAMRSQGMVYREIAEKFGVSRQYVAAVCGGRDPACFRPIGSSCVYENLRNWMNDHKVSRNEFVRRMGLEKHTRNCARFNCIMRGELQPRKDYIDRMLDVTGMPYEKLFYKPEVGDQDGK